jgi:C4-dicarboxylate-specific signal transduction histidine kinase
MSTTAAAPFSCVDGDEPSPEALTTRAPRRTKTREAIRFMGVPADVVREAPAPATETTCLVARAAAPSSPALEDRREVSNRLASLGTMVASVAHEINNPLCVILATAALVAEDIRRVRAVLVENGSRDADLVRSLDAAIEAQTDLSDAATRVVRIATELRPFCQPQRQVTPASDVNRAIAWAVRSTAHERQRRARLETNLCPTPAARVDEIELGQVLINLLTNAAQAISVGDAEHQRIKIASRTADDGQVVVEVSDTGSGIPSHVASRIFEPFFTTKEAGVGTGLGLSICAEIVKSAGGRIEVETAVGHGTTFRIVLPAAR